MKFGYVEILALGDRFSSAYKSIEEEISKWGNITYYQESKFEKAEDIIDYIRNSSYDVVMMPNPYGNERRRWCYQHLRNHNFPVIVFDRGALPESWFFDQGFNADSLSYHPLNWDRPLTSEQHVEIKQYIEDVKYKLAPLEKQGKLHTKKEIFDRLGIPENKKILLVAFQRPSDTTIKYFSNPIGSFDNFCQLVTKLNTVLRISGPEWFVIGKKHPLESKKPPVSIKFCDNEENINGLIEIADAVLVINSGVGLLASLWNKPVLYAGSAFYAHPQLNRQVRSVEDIVYALKTFSSINEEARDRLIFHLKNKVYSFGKFDTEIVLQPDGSYRNITRKINFYEVRKPEFLKKKRILYVSPVIPYPVNRGSAHRTNQIIEGLLELGCRVDFLLLNRSEFFNSSKSIKKRLEKHYSTLYFSAEVRRFPGFVEMEYKRNKTIRSFIKLSLRKFKQWLDSLLLKNAKINSEEDLPSRFKKRVIERAKEDFDIVWFNYAKMLPEALDTKAKIVIDLHDLQKNRIINEVLPKIKSEKRSKRYFEIFTKSEISLIRKADLNIAISSTEEKEIKDSYCPDAKILTINATDTNHNIGNKLKDQKYDLLFVGSNSYANQKSILWFIKNVWPLISDRGYKLLVQGAITRNNDVVKSLEKARNNKNIIQQKYVEDLKSVYANSKLVICPVILGTGMKIKVVEALSYGLPIVATSIALDGIPRDCGLKPSDTNEEFAERICYCLEPAHYKEQSAISKKTFEKHFSHKYLINQLKKVLSIIQSSRNQE